MAKTILWNTFFPFLSSFLGARQLGNHWGTENWTEQRPETRQTWGLYVEKEEMASEGLAQGEIQLLKSSFFSFKSIRDALWMLNKLLCHHVLQLDRSFHFHAFLPSLLSLIYIISFLSFIFNPWLCCYVAKIFLLCFCFLQRFFVLDNGILKYSKSPIDVSSSDCNSGAAWPKLCSAVSQQKHLQRRCHDVQRTSKGSATLNRRLNFTNVNEIYWPQKSDLH